MPNGVITLAKTCYNHLTPSIWNTVMFIVKQLYSRTPVERPPSPTTIPHIWPYFVWRTVFSVCAIPDRRPSFRRDQRLGQMGLSPSRTTTSPHIITMLCLDTFQVIQLLWTFFYFGDDATTTFSDRRCIVRYNVASLPALRNICSRPNSSDLNQPHPGSSYYQRQCNMVFYVKCYVNTLSNNDKDLYFPRLLSAIAPTSRSHQQNNTV